IASWRASELLAMEAQSARFKATGGLVHVKLLNVRTLNCIRLTLRLSLQHAVLHDDFIVHFHKHAPASVPEGCLAVAVARARARAHVRQVQLAAAETNVDKLVFWQMELSHHRLPIRTTKAQPLPLAFHVGLGTTQDCRQGYRRKRHFPGSSYRPNNTLHGFNSILSNQSCSQ